MPFISRAARRSGWPATFACQLAPTLTAVKAAVDMVAAGRRRHLLAADLRRDVADRGARSRSENVALPVLASPSRTCGAQRQHEGRHVVLPRRITAGFMETWGREGASRSARGTAAAAFPVVARTITV